LPPNASADDSQGAGLGGDDGEADGPPRGCAAAQEVVAETFLAVAEARPEPGDAGQICEDDCQIEVAHFLDFGVFQHSVDLL
jgi:hypothetical protein